MNLMYTLVSVSCDTCATEWWFHDEAPLSHDRDCHAALRTLGWQWHPNGRVECPACYLRTKNEEVL